VVLKMKATLFFMMLRKGRVIRHRERHRDYYEMLRVSAFPHVDREAKQEITGYFFENSLTPMEMQDRAELKDQLEVQSNSYAPHLVAENFLRDSARGMLGHGGR
jgi:hypothetical protein